MSFNLPLWLGSRGGLLISAQLAAATTVLWSIRELLIRWFQFGLTSPIFRQHGSRVVEPWTLQQHGASGEFAHQTVIKFIKLRHTLRSYVLQQMRTENGTPVNRPLSFGKSCSC